MTIGSVGYGNYGRNALTNQNPYIDQKMVEFLVRQGYGLNQIVMNIQGLKGDGVREMLEGKGFYHISSRFGDKIIDTYNLGDAHPGGYGQTIGIVSDGSVTLTTFAGAYTQIIGMDKSGKITQNHYT